MVISYGIAVGQSAGDQLKTYVEAKDYEKALSVIPQALSDKPKDVETLLLAGLVYTELEKYQDALKVYNKANDLDRKNIKTWILLGKAYSLAGDTKGAISVLKDAIERDEKNIFIRLELANVYMRSDSLSKAEMVITQAKDLDPKEPAAYIALGDLNFKMRVYEIARSNYVEALELNPDLLDARMKLATSYYWLAVRETNPELSSELFTRSLGEWNKVTQQDPKNAKAYYEQGKILFLSKNYVDAARSLNNFIILRPSGSYGRWMLAQSLEKIGRCDSAVTHLEIVAKEIDSVRIQAQLLIARCAFDNKSYQNAITLFDKASKDTALQISDYMRLGQAYLLTLDTVNALSTWEKSVIMDPAQNCQIMDQMGYIYQKQQKYQQAIDILTKRASIKECFNDKREHIVYYLIGQSYLLSNRPDSAVIALKKSIEIDSTFLFARVSIADAYAGLDNKLEAETVFNKIIEIGKSDTTKNKFVLQQSFSKLCQMQLEQKKYNEVISTGEKWSVVYPNDSYPYLFMAIAYHSTEKFSQACSNYRKVLKLDPKNTNATKNLKILTDANKCD
jgi:tetratricopeptide (TPR) repeat protein